ncbi:MAG: VIT family protein [Xanthomonadales bacterium]|jgi:VIT1/CCC1 family predicted Fe2+/Mn2+ transporter|nr:VIT family protein [Xanthomonadales bacterium]
MKRESFHRIHHTGWLRAAVMGANDGIVSTASLVVGVAAAHADRPAVLVAGVAGLVAGAMSMAAGEYVSVSSQADTENADLEREKAELAEDVEFETRELTRIYQRRGLDQDLAHQVAVQLMEHDALGAHARDELGITDTRKPRPLQAGLASAGTFAIGALLPLLAVAFAPAGRIASSVTAASLLALTGLGILSARAGGARIRVATARIVFWGALAMALTAAVGRWFGAVV